MKRARRTHAQYRRVVINARHRSAELAERHIKKIQREYRVFGEIESYRRNESGQFSNRGSYWQFIFTEERDEVFEWLCTFTYERTGKSFDVIVTARTEDEAKDTALEFLWTSVRGRHIMESRRKLKKGWTMSIAQANKTRRKSGLAQYRDESKE